MPEAKNSEPQLLPFPELADQNGGEVPYFSGVILDMDGTLVDSMGFWVTFDEDYARELGYEMNPEMAEEITAMGFRGTARWFIQEFNMDMTDDELVQLFIDRAVGFYRERAQEKPGASAYVRKLRERGVRIAVASSSSMTIVRAGLERIGVLDLVDVMVTTDDLNSTKSFPLVFEEAARQMGVPVGQCLTFEDITTAAESAKRAGTTTCGVFDANRQQDTESLKASTDFFIDSFLELL